MFSFVTVLSRQWNSYTCSSLVLLKIISFLPGFGKQILSNVIFSFFETPRLHHIFYCVYSDFYYHKISITWPLKCKVFFRGTKANLFIECSRQVSVSISDDLRFKDQNVTRIFYDGRNWSRYIYNNLGNSLYSWSNTII